MMWGIWDWKNPTPPKQSLRLKTAPTTEPIALTEAKAQCRVDITDDDSYISTFLIPTAREYCEGVLNRALITQHWELSFDYWPVFPFDVPLPPLISVESITYYDTTNTANTWDPSNYYVDPDHEPGRIALNSGISLPTTALRLINAVKIDFTCGYGDATTIPLKTKQAMLLLIGHWYNNRESVGKVGAETEFTVNALLGIDRMMTL
jgi:uncharacterized phiE125 gp8 family phage protein